MPQDDDDLYPTQEAQSRITRLEVIDENGRAYVRTDVLSGGSGVRVDMSLQDDGRTLKIFVNPRT